MSKLIHYSGPAGSILLPQGYTRLAYIESNADAWFSAGIAATANTKYKIKFSIKNKGSWNMMFGRWSNCVIGITPSMHLHINGSDIGVIKEDEICDVTASSSAVYFKSKNSITCNKVSAHPVKLAVFGGTGDSDTDNPQGYGKGRIYELKIWEGNTLIRDYVPAKNSSGVAGLLDLVDNSWHPSSTSTQFKAGPEIPQGFPTSKYCQVEWLGNEKATGYVAIPYTHKANTWVDTELAFTTIYHFNTIFGACTADNSSDSFTFGCMYSGRFNCDLGAPYQANAGLVANTFYRFLISPKTIIKDTTTYSLNRTTTTCDKTWALFTRHNNTSYTDEAGHGKFKYMKIYEGTFNSVSGSILKAHLIPCYRRSDMKPGFYDLVGRSFHEFVGPGASIGPSITFGYGEIVNNIEAEAHPMIGTQYTETNKFTHTGHYMDDFRGLTVYQRVEPGQQISISFDTDVTQWASGHDYSGINKGKWSMFTYFSKVYNPNKWTFDSFECYAVNQIKSLGGTRWKYSLTVPADMHMIQLRTNLYSDNSTSYTAHFWNFNWSFGDTGCQVNPLHAIPHNISTGDGRNGEKNGSFYGGGKGYIEFDGLPAESVKTVAFWVKSDKTNQCFYADPNSKTACGIFNNNFVIGCNKKN